MRRPLVLLALGLSSLLSPASAIAEVVPLEDLENRAVAKNPSIRAARARIDGARAEADEAAAARMPMLALRANAYVAPGGQLVEVPRFGSGDTERYQVFAAPSLGESDAWEPVPRYGVTAAARWQVLDFGRSSAAEQAAMLAASAGEQTVDAIEREIRLAVRRSYLAWAIAHELGQIAEEGATSATERAARVQRLIDSGQRPEADGAAAAVDVTTARLELARSEARLSSAKQTVEGIVGAPLAEDATPDTAVIDAEPPPTEGDPADRSLQAQRAAANALADAHSYRHRPLLDLETDLGVRGQSAVGFPVYRVAVVLSLPVFDGGAESAKERAARADARRISAELERHRRDREAEEALAEAAAERARSVRDAARALVQAAEERLAAAEAAYDSGAGSTELIATARETLLRARAEEVHARAELAEAQLR